MTLLASIFTADILPIFIIAGVGFLLARHLDASVQTLSRVVFNALAPCMVFNLLVTSRISADQFGRMALFSVLMTAGIGLVAWIASRPLHLERPALAAFLLVVMFSNGGNYGLPVVLFAFGRESLSHATVYFVTSAMLMYTVGVVVAATGRRSLAHALAGIVRLPTVYGVVAAAIVLAAGISVPVAVMRPVTLLSDATVPIMILVLGMQFERARRPERPGVVAVAVALSLLVTPFMALALAGLIGLEPAARQAAVIQASMPAAVATTILALEFNVAPSFVTSTVFVSTMLSPFTLTALIAYLSRAR